MTGSIYVEDLNNEKEMIQHLIDLKVKLNGLICDSFENSTLVQQALKDSLKLCINKRQIKPAEMLAKFMDNLLAPRKLILNVHTALQHCIELFRLVRDKDVFGAFYGTALSKRLLQIKSSSIDMERDILLKLKTECGSEFTTKFEQMLKDVDISKEIMRSFRENALAQVKLPSFEFSVSVLQSGSWPTVAPSRVLLPKDFEVCQKVFEEFYLSRHSGRLLKWQNNLGQCVLKSMFGKEYHELGVSVIQAAVLLLFNDRNSLTYIQIQQRTDIVDEELCRILQSLSVAKYKLLQKSSKSRDVLRSDSFDFNTEFTHPQFKILVNQIVPASAAAEEKQVVERVFSDRVMSVDACIIRILKSKKKILHKNLVVDLYEKLKFAIQPTDLKKRIESLIGQDFIERDSGNHQMYIYRA